MASGNAPSSVFLSAPDGLRLHARCYGRPSSPALPVVCLSGLARTAADFETVAAVRGSMACVALAGQAAAFAWRDGELSGQRRDRKSVV